MSIGVSYMGTKRQLASFVQKIAEDCKSGILLDAFSGVCTVGCLLAPSRQIWSNDLQHFSNRIANALFCAELARPDVRKIIESTLSTYENHFALLETGFCHFIAREDAGISLSDAAELTCIFDESVHSANQNSETDKSAYDLFVSRYGGNYLSYKQAISIDSIRYGLDLALKKGLIGRENFEWALIALCRALALCSSTTGHFAQPLSPNQGNLLRFKRQRKRDVWHEWVASMATFHAYGCIKWRKKNRCFNSDANDLLAYLKSETRKPSVVYADPPYTKDQYSRYYHLFETVLQYDYPIAEGRGLYRGDRELSAFSHSSKIENSMRSLIQKCAELNADLILSYPKSGLMRNSYDVIPRILKEHYRGRIDVFDIAHSHSTFGASKGLSKNAVTEVIYRACVQ